MSACNCCTDLIGRALARCAAAMTQTAVDSRFVACDVGHDTSAAAMCCLIEAGPDGTITVLDMWEDRSVVPHQGPPLTISATLGTR